MILSTLAKKGANPFHLAQSMKNLGMLKEETKAACKEAILKAFRQLTDEDRDVLRTEAAEEGCSGRTMIDGG